MTAWEAGGGETRDRDRGERKERETGETVRIETSVQSRNSRIQEGSRRRF